MAVGRGCATIRRDGARIQTATMSVGSSWLQGTIRNGPDGRHMGVVQEDFMAMMKGAAAGAAIGALALGTVLFVAPIAAQAPMGPGFGRGDMGPGSPGPGGGRGDMRPGMGPGRGDVGQDTTGRRGPDPNDPDITGPRGELGLCQERLNRMAQARLEHIQRQTRPTEEQRPAFDELRMASIKAVEILRAACPAERPLTPPGRMAMAEKWLEARLQASKTVRPAVESFFRVLSDEQKIRWIMGSDASRGEPRGDWRRWGGWGGWGGW